MEKKGFKWQMCVGAVFMIIIIISLFLPSMSISGEKYLKTAVQINKYAKDEDSKTAKKAQVDKKVIDKYKENTSKWDDKVKEFDDKIDKKDKGSSISQIMLVKWLFTADDEIDDIEGITKKAGEKIVFASFFCMPFCAGNSFLCPPDPKKFYNNYPYSKEFSPSL